MRIAVTGAFGYSGRYIARRLLEAGHDLLTLTNSPRRPNPFGDRLAVAGFNFDAPDELAKSLAGIETLINTYWVRFNHRLFTYEQAVANTRILFDAAKRAGVRRVVHISITNPDRNSDLGYFRGKAQLEEHLVGSGLSYAILRPTVLFGREDILVNNIAWGLRHVPVYGVFGDGEYRLQPIYVEDLAALAADQALLKGDTVINAIGPETFTFRGMVEMIATEIGVRRRIVSVSPGVGCAVCKVLGWFVDDVVITREEIRGLMEGRLYVDDRPAGHTKLSEWVRTYHQRLGLQYTSEMARRIDRGNAYKSN